MTYIVALKQTRVAYYDPNTGRFLQLDPEPGKLNIPESILNRSLYTANNPMNLSDPSGKSFIGDLFAGLAGAVAAFFAAPFVIGLLGVANIAGTGGAILSVITGIAGGALAGGLAGGIVGGFDSLFAGEGFAKGFWHGAVIGAVTGGITGGFVGYGAWIGAQGISVAGGVSVARAGGCAVKGLVASWLAYASYALATAPEPTGATKGGAIAAGLGAAYFSASTISCYLSVNVVPDNAT